MVSLCYVRWVTRFIYPFSWKEKSVASRKKISLLTPEQTFTFKKVFFLFFFFFFFFLYKLNLGVLNNEKKKFFDLPWWSSPFFFFYNIKRRKIMECWRHVIIMIMYLRLLKYFFFCFSFRVFSSSCGKINNTMISSFSQSLSLACVVLMICIFLPTGRWNLV